MQIEHITFCVALAGTLIVPSLTKNTNVDLPDDCIMDDPFFRDHEAINMTFNPILELLEGSTLENVIVEGLSNLRYKLELNPLLLTLVFEMYIPQVTWNATYNAEGYLDARPFRQVTIPSGNFTGSDVGLFSAKYVRLIGSGSIFLNLQGKVQLSRLVLLEASFESLTVDLGRNFTIAGGTVDFDELNRNIKANFDRDLADNKNAIQDKMRLAINEILKPFTIEELQEQWELITRCSDNNITPPTSPTPTPLPTTTITTSTTTEKNDLPECPVVDPLLLDRAAVMVTLDPIYKVEDGSFFEDLTVDGLSMIRYNISFTINPMFIYFDIDVPSFSSESTNYNAEGYLDFRPFSEETIPSGNFTGSGLGTYSATNVKFKGNSSFFINLQGRVQLTELFITEFSFESLNLDLGADFSIGGNAVDWAEWSRNVKSNYDRDMAENPIGTKETIQEFLSLFLQKFTFQEFLYFVGECGPGPVTTTVPPTTTTMPTSTASTPTTTTASTTTEMPPVTPPDGFVNGTCPDGLADGQACDPLTECNQCGFCDFYFHCQAQTPRTGEWRKTTCSMRGDPINDIIRVEDKMFFHIGATPFGGMCAPGIPSHLEDEYLGDPTCKNPCRFWQDEGCSRAYWHSDPDYSKGIWSDPGTRLLCAPRTKWDQEMLNCVFCEEGENCDCQ